MHPETSPPQPPTRSPREIAEWLRASSMTEGEVLDMLKFLGDIFGWTAQLNEVGLYYMKPESPPDREEAASA